MHKVKALIIRLAHHRGENFFHMTYLGMVGWEAHGGYKYAAIALLIVIVVNLVNGIDVAAEME